MLTDGRFSPVRKHERYYALCAKCGQEREKRFMAQIYIKGNSYEPMRILRHLCQRCLPAMLDELEVTMPD